MPRLKFFAPALIAGAMSIPSALASTVDFETVPSGTSWGDSFGQMPGEVVLMQNDIDMSVEEFQFGKNVGFTNADIRDPLMSVFPTQWLRLININVQFDFTSVGFGVDQVTLEFVDFGGPAGPKNVAVNGGTIFELDEMSDLPMNVATGVTASVTETTLTLLGDVDTLLIGGMELGLDNVMAVPEPAAGVLLMLGAGWVVIRSRNRRPA